MIEGSEHKMKVILNSRILNNPHVSPCLALTVTGASGLYSAVASKLLHTIYIYQAHRKFLKYKFFGSNV